MYYTESKIYLKFPIIPLTGSIKRITICVVVSRETYLDVCIRARSLRERQLGSIAPELERTLQSAADIVYAQFVAPGVVQDPVKREWLINWLIDWFEMIWLIHKSKDRRHAAMHCKQCEYPVCNSAGSSRSCKMTD